MTSWTGGVLDSDGLTHLGHSLEGLQVTSARWSISYCQSLSLVSMYTMSRRKMEPLCNQP